MRFSYRTFLRYDLIFFLEHGRPTASFCLIDLINYSNGKSRVSYFWRFLRLFPTLSQRAAPF